MTTLSLFQTFADKYAQLFGLEPAKVLVCFYLRPDALGDGGGVMLVVMAWSDGVGADKLG